jgi:iron complex outermembrane receptor protein
MKSVHRSNRRAWRAGLAVLGFVFTTGLVGAASAAGGQGPPVNLTEASLEELLTMNITSAGKKNQLITETAAAIYVITSDDIQRYNASTITELLRQVPGIQVAREATGEWSISIRGFNDKHANKLLVLLDGRTLYSPMYSGVEWDVHDTMIEDIHRIEIIRGPGASLWGANAVNGVINVITKQAADTRGGLVTYHAGAFDKGSIAARYGGSIGKNAQYRVFSKYFTRPSLENAAGITPYGGWNSLRQGGRLDWSPTPADVITVSGDWSLSNLREVDDEITSFTAPFESTVQENDKTRTSFLLTRWNRKQRSGGEFDVRFFYDRNRQYDGLGHDKDESIETADIEFNQRLKVLRQHDLVWGGGFRQVRDRVEPAFDSWFVPVSRTARTYNGFVQDEIALLHDSVRLTAGSKFEWNSFSKTEVQPTARVLWALTHRHSFWTAASRAVRVPSRNEHDQYELDSISENEEGEVEYELLVPSPAFRPEKLTSYEAGYRFLSATRASLDVASFYNIYDDLQTIETQSGLFTATPFAGVMTPLVRANNSRARVAGAEVTVYWTVNDVLQLSGNYTRLHMQLHADSESNDEGAEAFEGKNAKNLFYVRAYADLPRKVNLTAELRYVGEIPGEEIPRYLEGNIHISRAIRHGLRLAVTLDNLMRNRHAEWSSGSMVESRAIRASLNWSFGGG